MIRHCKETRSLIMFIPPPQAGARDDTGNSSTKARCCWWSDVPCSKIFHGPPRCMLLPLRSHPLLHRHVNKTEAGMCSTPQ